MRLANIFWPLARPCVTLCISEAPHERDVGLLNCVLGVKTAFSEIFPVFKCWCVEMLCENVFVLQSTDVDAWVLFCLHYVLIELVDFRIWD